MTSEKNVLSDRALRVVKMYDDDGLSFEEIGPLLGIHATTAGRDYKRVKTVMGGGNRPEHTNEFKVEEPVSEEEYFEGMEIAPGVKASTDGPNAVTLEVSENDLIHTIPGLLEACKVDLEVWAVKDPEVSTWPGWRKDKKVEITWTDGRADGYVKDSGGINVRQLFRVFARLVRKEPEAVRPIILPIESTITFELPDPVYIPGQVYRSLVIADLQVGFRRGATGQLTPFHDRRVLDLALQIAAESRPDRIDLIGDCLDLPSWSLRWIKEPEFVWTTQPAINELHYWLTLLRKLLPDAEINYFEGNHEKRLPDTIMSILPPAYELTPADMDVPVMSLPFLLGFEKLGINFFGGYPNNISYLGKGVAVVHGTISRKNPGDTAKEVARGANRTVVYGHGHALEYVGWVHDNAFFGDAGGDMLVDAFCPGCGCRVDYEVPGHVKSQIWRQGLGEIDYTLEGDHHITPIPIRDGRAMYGGQIYKARPETTTEGLYEAWPGYQWTTPGREFWQ